jgi:adenylate cyclase
MAAGNGGIASRNYPEAIVHFERAIELDEHAIRPAGMVVQAYQGIGDTENAEAASRRVLARCERVLAIEPDHSMALSFFVNALADLGEAERARAWTRRAILFDPDNARLHYNLACAMSRLQDAEAACDLLDGIIDRVSKGWLLWMGQDNSLDPMRDHPRFRAVMERGRARVGLPAS